MSDASKFLNSGNSGDLFVNSFLQMIETESEILKLGFRVNFANNPRRGSIRAIYESNRCRIKFSFSRQQMPQFDELSIRYGRLHAPNLEPFMKWREEECRCWHDIYTTLKYFDNKPTTNATEQAIMHKGLHPILDNFRNSDIGRQLFEEYPPKAVLVLHSKIWSEYGNQLFDLFDLKNTGSWEKYRKFVTEHYRVLDMKASYGPPYGNVC